MRSVPRRPLTLAEMRVVCREASETKTSSAGMPLARASEKIGLRMVSSVSRVYLLKSGKMKTGAIRKANATSSVAVSDPQIYQVLGARRSTP